MISRSEKIRSMMAIAFEFSKKSGRQNTPRLFKNPKLTPRGWLYKIPKSYDYDLPEDLPNRHLYWNKTQMNKIRHQKYKAEKLRKLKINPIINSQNQRTFDRPLPQLIAQMTSVRLIKSSPKRAMQNIYEAITRFPDEFVGTFQDKKLVRGESFDVLNYIIREVHDRHLATMNFYTFSSYCQLRYMAKMRSTPQILCHFFKHLEGFKEQNQEHLVPFGRLSRMSNFIFNKKYPGEFDEILFKREAPFQLFEDVEPDNKSFEHIMPDFYSEEQLQNQVQFMKGLAEKDQKVILGSIQKIPGGKKLVERAQAYL